MRVALFGVRGAGRGYFAGQKVQEVERPSIISWGGGCEVGEYLLWGRGRGVLV